MLMIYSGHDEKLSRKFHMVSNNMMIKKNNMVILHGHVLTVFVFTEP